MDIVDSFRTFFGLTPGNEKDYGISLISYLRVSAGFRNVDTPTGVVTTTDSQSSTIREAALLHELGHHFDKSRKLCRGRQFSIAGLTGPSQRAEAIFSLNHYLFYGDPSRNLQAMGYGYEEERDWAVKEFLETRHNGQSADIACGRADALEQTARAAHWRPPSKRHTEPRTYSAVRPISWIRANENKKQMHAKKYKTPWMR